MASAFTVCFSNILILDFHCKAFDLALPLAELKEEFELITDSQFAYGDKGKYVPTFILL